MRTADVGPADIAASDEKHRELLLHMNAPRVWGKVRMQQIVADLIRNRRFQLMRLPQPGSGRAAFLNVGCGLNFYKGFFNLDYKWIPGIDLCWDLTHPLPYPAKTFRGIFAEHCLEHIRVDLLCSVVFLELRRVLQVGGVLRMVTNDAEPILDDYYQAKVHGELGQPLPGLELMEAKALDGVTPVTYVNRQFRQFGHQFIFDYPTLERALSRAGFVDIRRERFMHGRQPDLLVDSSHWLDVATMYVEAAAL